MADGPALNRCTVSPSRSELPAPSRRSRCSRTRLWYAFDHYTLPMGTISLPMTETSPRYKRLSTGNSRIVGEGGGGMEAKRDREDEELTTTNRALPTSAWTPS